ncbi:MAG: UDP-4-amino-4,6-dideoxy-N-acetyl-beta-L-altrosamine transaminase [Deltaproteobacteria bacterium]|nr:UDP-4-amino-4,6-dideoxy-N-acetyl-beta-L-altrosamine transaminase [Deltaproteobacteria bacterium]
MIPYGKQCIDGEDIQSVIDVLRSDWLTTGPMIELFEKAFADFVGARYAVAVNSGTAALHAAMFALGIGSGDEVIVPTMTFVATANCVVFQGGTPVFADVDPGTLLIDPATVESCLSPKTKAIIAVDYAGQPCDYDKLQDIAKRHNLALVSDACHSLGGHYKDNPVGILSDINAFSFHPVKHITTGEGGMITTDDQKLAGRMRLFRNHGISTDYRQRKAQRSWFYEMVDLGYNYRITDFQCALGISQLKKLPQWIERRREIAHRYDEVFSVLPRINPLPVGSMVFHAYHLYVVRLNLEGTNLDRGMVFKQLQENGIGVNVHYIPVHLHPFYRSHFKTHPGMCPVAEQAYEEIISLPMYPGLSDAEQDYVIEMMRRILS